VKRAVCVVDEHPTYDRILRRGQQPICSREARHLKFLFTCAGGGLSLEKRFESWASGDLSSRSLVLPAACNGKVVVSCDV